jgi:hypothetical protein
MEGRLPEGLRTEGKRGFTMPVAVEKQGQGHPEPEQGPNVTITVDSKDVTIHRGRQTVAAIKAAAGVPDGYVLVQEKDGRLEELSDDGAVTLKGGEIFHLQPKQGTSA